MHPHIQILRALNDAQVRYVVVGGIAVALQGHLRATVDVDVVIELVPDNVSRTVEALSSIGLTPRVPVNGLDLANEAVRRSWVEERNMIALSFGNPNDPTMVADVFVASPIDPSELIASSVPTDFGDLVVPVASIEHLISMKRTAGRHQDLADIEALEALRD